MLSREQNDLVTQTGPGTPGGDMMRRYWQPVALSEELNADDPLPVRILSEDLVLFRDDQGRPQLIDRLCPHRSVDLSYGRVEHGGLRCLYHGWLLSGAGRCLEQPAEPAGSSYKDKVRFTAYPCREAGGLIMTYMGPGEPPRFPDFPFMKADASRVWTGKLRHACNYLQGSEGNVDPQHLSYLHQFASGANSLYPALNALVVGDVAPRIEVQETPFGLRLTTLRDAGEGRLYARITNFITPNSSAFDGVPLNNPHKETYRDNMGYQFHWHVPIDDYSHWKYTVIYRYEGALDKEWISDGLFGAISATYESPRNAGNRYQQDRAEMKTTSFAGLGRNFYDHDLWAVEAQGPIVDRSRERLGTADRPVMIMRKMLLQAIDDVRAGRDPLFVERDGMPNALDDLAVRTGIIPAGTNVAGKWWEEASAPASAAKARDTAPAK